MNDYIKKHINTFISIFIILGPFIDLITGLCIHQFNLNITLGVIFRFIFLLSIVLITLFVYKKKKLLIPYIGIGLYSIFYVIGIILYKNSSLFTEVHSLVKCFYFPILFISLYAINDEVKISKMTLFTTLFLYLIMIFVPTALGIGYKTYEITKAGTLGFFNAANEISGIISILTPVIFIIFYKSKNIIPKIILGIMYLVVILMMGTKTPFLTLGITIFMSLLYILAETIKNKRYKTLIASLLIVVIGTTSILMIIPKTNFYKNIQTHLDYLKVEKVTDIFKDEKLIDHFIFSQRLTFLNKRAKSYHKANTYQKIFGMGYTKNNKQVKLIEMDYFDIYYNHGIIGFIVFMSIMLYVVTKILKTETKITYETYMVHTSALLIIFLSFVTGHIVTAPAVDIIVIIILLSLIKRNKKDLLFADKNLEIGGIEAAQVNLINRIDLDKYNVTIILEEKKGELLKKLDNRVIVKELKVSNNKNVIIRKLINVIRKLTFKILNYDNYDFSCCYTTYSYSCNKIAKIASSNCTLYVHSDYKYVYNDEKDFREFFDSRKTNEYKKIIFVSNESRNSYLKVYKDQKDKTLVLNNFVDIEKIKELSNEKVSEVKNNNKELFVFVGRLDDSSKKLKRAINLVKELNINLWVIGDGPDRKMYEEYAKELKVEKSITFFGKQSNPYKYMKQADYIILTSDYEGFPVVYLEALVLDKQIITTINTSDDEINIKDYAYVVDKNKIAKEVKLILKDKSNKKKIDLEKIYEKRMIKFYEIFND